MNRTQLIGRLGRDPEGGRSGTGTYANFSLATNEYWTDRTSGELVEHTEWHQLVCYDRLAEIALEFLTKGSEIYVEGRQRTTRWTDKDGKEQRGSEIRVDELKMLRRAPKSRSDHVGCQRHRVDRKVAQGRRPRASNGCIAGGPGGDVEYGAHHDDRRR